MLCADCFRWLKPQVSKLPHHPHGGLGLETALNSPLGFGEVGDRSLIAMAGPYRLGNATANRHVQTHGTGRSFVLMAHFTESALPNPAVSALMDRRHTSPIAKSARFVASGWLTSLKCEQCAAGELFGFC